MQETMNTNASDHLVYKLMDSPVGKIQLIAGTKGLVAILWEGEGFNRIKLDMPSEDKEHPILRKTEDQLNAYFAGERKSFDIPLDLRGTPFQQQVWHALLTIPFGVTKSYGAIARQIGDPKTVRAVGGALNKNPVSIIVPCHRVIGASGKLVGFAGGLTNKSYLLNIEGIHQQPVLCPEPA
jgi:methylated-DNA-[protein]-cysteine S-methyltransferase